MNIYQAIWDADQTGSGVRPVLAKPDEVYDEAHGYVKVVTRTERNGDLSILPEVVIPPHKAHL